MPVFEDPSNQALLAKLQELGSINLWVRFVKLYAKAAWSGEEAQLFMKLTCGFSLNAKSSELEASNLDKKRVNDLKKEAAKHRRLLGLKKQDWGGIDPGVTQAVSAASGVWDQESCQVVADQLAWWKLTKDEVRQASGQNSARRDTHRWLVPIQHLAAASSASTSLEANLKHITVTLATWDTVWEVYLGPMQRCAASSSIAALPSESQPQPSGQ
ncbi:hypothetical protein HaLaN_21831 [Haematococcus lacustris]|uniref:Uncharacterized protein n=1 Tax=Haematococcus lacustris TaxID=44745 RepID=A0A699ZZA2_HAELA|nr:hypothetical protein HaLaN_21831 [Haematococcus lacustris]